MTPVSQQQTDAPNPPETEPVAIVEEVPVDVTSVEELPVTFNRDLPDKNHGDPEPVHHVTPREMPQVTHDGVTDPRDEQFDALFRNVDAVPEYVPESAAPIPQVVELQMTDAERAAHEQELVPVLIRRDVPRMRISGKWLSFRKGSEVFVTRAQALWLREKDII